MVRDHARSGTEVSGQFGYGPEVSRDTSGPYPNCLGTEVSWSRSVRKAGAPGVFPHPTNLGLGLWLGLGLVTVRVTVRVSRVGKNSRSALSTFM